VPNTARTDVVAYCPISTTPPLQYRVVKILLPQSEFPENLLRYGDKIQLGGRGTVYTICWDGLDGLYPIPTKVINPNLRIAKRNTNASKLVPPDPLVPGKGWPDDYNPNTQNDDPSGYLTYKDDPTYTADNKWITNYCLTCYADPQDQTSLPWVKTYPVPLATAATPYPMQTSFGGSIGGISFMVNGPVPPVSFTISRQPVTASTGSPLQLPTGAGIDLPVSGGDNGGLFNVYPTATAILFSPNGSVESINIGGTVFKPSQTIYLLVGKTTVTALNSDGTIDLNNSEPDGNWFDMKNVIVSINPQTGTVSTNPVYPPYMSNSAAAPPYSNDPPTSGNVFDPAKPPAVSYTDNGFLQALFYSRKFAREAQTMGGKR
jgi:hypothetical protein